MYLILFCSFGAITIFTERFMYYHTIKTLPHDFSHQLDSMLGKGDIEDAARFCRDARNVAAEIAAKGIDCMVKAPNRVEIVMESEATLCVAKLRQNVNHLESIVTVAPLLGLLGTVVGMMDSFKIMNIKSGEPLAITGGIGEALTATAFGLCVAVVALAAYSYFSHRLSKIITDIEEVSAILIRRMR